MPTHRPALLSCIVALALVAGCGHKNNPLAVHNSPPEVHFDAPGAPLAGAGGAIHAASWTGSDRDGRVDHYLVAVNPISLDRVDAGWTSTVDRSIPVTAHRAAPLSAGAAAASGGRQEPMIVAVRAVDDRGAVSDPVERAYFGDNVAPTVQITSPRPSRLIQQVLPPSFVIRWEGSDPDGQSTQRPVKYKFKVLSDADPEFPIDLAISRPDSLRNFYAPSFAGWDSLSGDSTSVTYKNFIPGQRYLFVITAIDEAGDYDPVFSLDKNILVFTVSYAEVLGPRITMFNEYFYYSYPTGGFTTDPAAIVDVTVPADVPVKLDWYAQAAVGQDIQGYRWTLDIADVFDETPRLNERRDLSHWSAWNLATTSATIGPFAGRGTEPDHLFYIEARSDLGLISLGILRIHVVRTRFNSDLLIVDDTRFQGDQAVIDPATGRLTYKPPVGPWPNAAELDTFLYARGGVPWREYPAGTMSSPGLFSGYAFDTLGTSNGTPDPMVSLEVLGRYRRVVWLVDSKSAPLMGTSTTSLRWMAARGHVNALAQYVERGGHLWIAGGGAGYASTIDYNDRSNDLAGTTLFSSAGTHPELVPGRFMYEVPRWQTEFRVKTLSGASIQRSPFPIGQRWSRMQYALLPDQMAPRSPATDPLPPLRSSSSGFYSDSRSLEWLTPPGGSVVECGRLGWRWGPHDRLDTLMVATGGGLPPQGQNPAVDRIVNPVMTAYGVGMPGSVVFTGFDVWSFKRADCVRLVDAVLQGMWHMQRRPLPPPATTEAIALERAQRGGAGRSR